MGKGDDFEVWSEYFFMDCVIGKSGGFAVVEADDSVGIPAGAVFDVLALKIVMPIERIDARAV